MTPMPLGAGQISLLISFIIQRWWPSPSVGPLSRTVSTHSSGLSRQKTQPRKLALRNRLAMSSLPSSEIQSSRDEDAVLEGAGSEVGHLHDVQLVERVQLARVRVLRFEHLSELGGLIDITKSQYPRGR